MSVYIGKLEGQKDLWAHTLRKNYNISVQKTKLCICSSSQVHQGKESELTHHLRDSTDGG
eukprot:12010151-Heterocapsa_arctica.AAC.1